MAVAWPLTAELAKRLDVTTGEWDDQLGRVLASAIAMTKQRVGDWDEDFDQPDEAIAQSALELAVEIATTGEAGAFTPRDTSKSKRLLLGKRRRFAVG